MQKPVYFAQFSNKLFAVIVILILSGCQSLLPSTPSEADLTVQPANTSLQSQPTPELQPATASPQLPLVPEMQEATATLPPPPSFPLTGIELSRGDSTSIDLAIEAGAFWIRRNAISWSAVEPEEGLRNWGALADLEREMVAVNQRGSKLILVITSTPNWAQAVQGTSCGPVAREKLLAFSQFLYELVLRYSAPPYSVKYWELGNEPDIDPSLVTPDSIYGCWGDKGDPYYGGGYYARMLEQVYPQIKSADPESQVLVGGLLMDCDPVNPPEGKSCQSTLFLEGILRAGGGDFFDGISFHAYDYYAGENRYGNPNWHSSWDTNGPVLISKIRYIKSMLASYQIIGKILVNTEVGMLCGSTGEEPICQSREAGLTKAFYTVEANFAAQAEGLIANIWYNLHGWRGTGLVDPQGIPLPAYSAYSFSARQLFGMGLVRAVNDIPGVRGYELARGDKRLMVFWSIDGQDHIHEFVNAPSAIYNVFGDFTQPKQEIIITRQPIYVEW